MTKQLQVMARQLEDCASMIRQAIDLEVREAELGGKDSELATDYVKVKLVQLREAATILESNLPNFGRKFF